MGLLDTPSSGKDEVIRALRGLAASDGRFVPPRRLRWQLGPRALVADITTVLGSFGEDDRVLSDEGGNVSLSTTGVLYSRIHRPQRRFSDT